MSFYEQDKELIDKFIAGKSQAEIARDLKISRTRVGQRLARNGFSGRNDRWMPKREDLLSMLEKSSSLLDAAELLGLTELKLHTAIKYHGVNDAFEKARELWKTHRREEYYLARQRPFINQIRELALRLGYTPRQEDLQTAGISHMTLIRTFGSLPNAMLASGLVPNKHRYTSPLPQGFVEVNTSVTDVDEVHRRANLLRHLYADIPEPAGREKPEQTTITTSVYYRDPRVVAWVLDFADGICELCGMQGYETDAGIAYLEVHHVVQLSEGGPDKVSNAVAVCEICHGKLHRAKNRAELKKYLYRNVARLHVANI